MGLWSKNFTQIENVNSGREVELNDVPTPQMFNVALNNTQYLYDLLQTGFLKSITASANGLTIVIRGVNKQETTVVISQSDLNMYTKTEIDDAIANMVKFSAQTLTEAQKTQARANIGAGDGDYNNLTNKPDLKTVATSGSYNDLTNKLVVHHISINVINEHTAYVNGRVGDCVYLTLTTRDNYSYASVDTTNLFTAIQNNGGLVSATGFVQDSGGNRKPIQYVNKVSNYLNVVAIDGSSFKLYTQGATVSQKGYSISDTFI